MVYLFEYRGALLLALCLLSGCREVIILPDPMKAGYGYFPLQVGDFRIYEVKDYSAGKDTTLYQLKVLVADSYINEEGDSTYIMNDYTRMDVNEDWQVDSVYTRRVNEFQAIQNKGNHNTLEMVFPVKEAKVWDWNSLNPNDPLRLKMINISQPYKEWPNTITVINESQISQPVFKVYAGQLGLVHALMQGENKIYTLTDHGLE